MNIHAKIEDGEVKALLGTMQTRLSNLSPAMKIIGEVVARSVRENFDKSGRPEKWPLSQRARKTGGKTLLLSGRLQRSITSRAFADRAEIGTNAIYAAVHQFGFSGTVNVFAHSRKDKRGDIRQGKKKIASGVSFAGAHSRKMNIPARPFLMVQDEDWGSIADALNNYLTGGLK